MAKHKLKRELGLLEASAYGVGIILGAGVYALIGKAAGMSGPALWLSFLIGACIAAITQSTALRTEHAEKRKSTGNSSFNRPCSGSWIQVH